MVAGKSRVAVIGAGPCGLTQLRELSQLPALELVCFDRGGEPGGMWNYQKNVGIDTDGLPVHTALYNNLKVNSPRYLIQVPDFPIPESVGYFPKQEDFTKYWHSFTKKFGLAVHIRTRSVVENITQENDKYRISVRNTRDETRSEEEFDCVIICNGHNSCPIVPKYPGVESFKGRQLHVHDYRDPEEFAGQKVLIVGTSFSGDDLNFKLQPFAAKVYASYRRESSRFRYDLPKTEQHPAVELVEGSTFHFADGEKREIDTVIYCTGYKFDYPFLSAGLQPEIHCKVRFPLWRHIVHPDHPGLLFPGLHYEYNAPQFYTQAKWTAAYLGGLIPLKSATEKFAEISELNSRYPAGETTTRDGLDFEFRLYNEMLDEAGSERLPAVMDDLKILYQQIYDSSRHLCYQLEYDVISGEDGAERAVVTYPPKWHKIECKESSNINNAII